MAQVSMDIVELDSLRDSIKAKETKVKELEKRIVEIEADKRIIQITATINNTPSMLPLMADIPNDITSARIFDNGSLIKRVLDSVKLRHSTDDDDDYNFSMHSRDPYSSTPYPFNVYIGNNSSKTITTKEYINFDETKQELRQQMENRYNEELGVLRATRDNCEQRIVELQAGNSKEKQSLIKNYTDRIEQLTNSYKEILQDKEKKIIELETGIKETTEIEDLKKQLTDLLETYEQEVKKPWWKKLFNK